MSAQAAVVVLVVPPVDELAAKLQAVCDVGETVGELRPVLQHLELALRERIVIGPNSSALGVSEESQAIPSYPIDKPPTPVTEGVSGIMPIRVDSVD